jgi:hypothetical protein
MTRPTCSIAGCTAPVRARGYCTAHYRRWQRHGEPRADHPGRAQAPASVGYWSVRRQLRAERGPASAQQCADCGGSARDWVYDSRDPDERTDPRLGCRYSLDLSRYTPRCRSCRQRALATVRGPRLDPERAARLYRAGASGPGIAAYLGVSRATVYRALRSYGVPIRSRTTRHHPPDTTDSTTHTTTTELPHRPDIT